MKAAWIPPTRNTATRRAFLDGLIFGLMPFILLAFFALLRWLR